MAKHVAIFTGGRLQPGRFVKDALAAADLIIAADSGALAALKFKRFPSVVIGDFDSLDKTVQKKLAAKSARLIAYSRDKDRTDTELAIAYAIENGATAITVLGGVEGDRLDHVLANVFSMVGSAVPIKFVNGSMTAWVVKGPVKTVITGEIGDTLSLVPLTARATGLTTAGLRWPLRGETLRMDRGRGVSNVMTREQAAVSLSKGTLLFVQTAVRAGAE